MEEFSSKVSRVIGVVGGVGPYAGLDFNRKIFDNTVSGGADQGHLQVILYSTGPLVTDRTEWLRHGRSESPAMGLYHGLRALRYAGADVAAIACNTAHSTRIMEPLKMMLEQGEVEIELVDVIEETGRFIRNHLAGESRKYRVGLLSTLGTLETGVYDRLETAPPGGIEIVTADRETAERVHWAIYDREWGIKALSVPVSGRARDACLEGVRHLAEKGVQAVILGCTELPLAVPEREVDGLPMVDPAEITARALIARAGPHKLKPLEGY